MSMTSTVGKASSKHPKSLRTTIPEPACVFLELAKGDKVEWTMGVPKDGQDRFVEVRKSAKAQVSGVVKVVKTSESRRPVPEETKTYHIESGGDGTLQFEGLVIDNEVLLKGIVVKVGKYSEGDIHITIAEVTES